MLQINPSKSCEDGKTYIHTYPTGEYLPDMSRDAALILCISKAGDLQ